MKALVLGAGGFIGAHLVKKLKSEGFWVRGVDIKYPPYIETAADDFVIADLTSQHNCERVLIAILMKFTSSPPTWVVRDIFSPVRMTQMLC